VAPAVFISPQERFIMPSTAAASASDEPTFARDELDVIRKFYRKNAERFIAANRAEVSLVVEYRRAKNRDPQLTPAKFLAGK
jgi:hypothetical protein